METIGVVYAVLAIFNTTQNIYDLVRKIRRVEGAKVDQLYYRLLLEKKRTEGWVNNMRVKGASPRAIVSPEEFEDLILLLERLKEHYDLAASRYSRFNAAQEQTERGFIARVKLVYGGYDDFKDLLDTLAVMNAALYAMAPPFPPGYSPTQSAPDYAATNPVQSDLLAAFNNQSSGRENPDTIFAEDTPSVMTRATDAPPKMLELDVNLPTLTLQMLYSLALKSMMVIGNARENPRLIQIGHRLHIWGIGLFENSVSLDEILTSSNGDNNLMIECIRKALVRILVLEERELTSLSGETNGIEQGKFQSAQEDITSLLIAEETFTTATLIWKSLVEDEADPERKPKDVFFTAQIVESLFDILPTIMTMRQSFFLRLESSHKKQSFTEATDSNNEFLVGSNVNQNLKTIKSTLKVRGQKAQKRGQEVQLYEPMLEKALEQRAKPSKSHKQSGDTKLLDKKEIELSEVIDK